MDFTDLCLKSTSLLPCTNNPTAHEVIQNPQLRRDMPWHVQIEGKTVPHYVVKEHKAPLDPGVSLETGPGEFFNIALKVSNEVLLSAKQIQIGVERNYIPEYTATVLKAAHLTLFHILGYRYVFGTAGLMLANILSKFYMENRKKDRRTQEESGESTLNLIQAWWRL